MENHKDLIAAVARLSRMMRRRPVENESLSHMSYHVLRTVQQNEGIRAKELAEQIGIRPASIAEALNRLENDGYITRQQDASDARAKRIYITEKTREQLDERSKSKQADNDRLLSCLTEEEADAFLAACDKLCAFLEQEAPEQEYHTHKHRHKKQHGGLHTGHNHEEE